MSTSPNACPDSEICEREKLKKYCTDIAIRDCDSFVIVTYVVKIVTMDSTIMIVYHV